MQICKGETSKEKRTFWDCSTWLCIFHVGLLSPLLTWKAWSWLQLLVCERGRPWQGTAKVQDTKSLGHSKPPAVRRISRSQGQPQQPICGSYFPPTDTRKSSTGGPTLKTTLSS